MDLIILFMIGSIVLLAVVIALTAHEIRHVLDSSKSKQHKALWVFGLIVALLVTGFVGFSLLLSPLDGAFH